MNVGELMEMLEGMDENAEVRIAYQPNYPLQCAVGAVTDLTEKKEGVCLGCGGGVAFPIEECECEPEDQEKIDEENQVVWIATGNPTASGYAPRAAWDGDEEY